MEDGQPLWTPPISPIPTCYSTWLEENVPLRLGKSERLHRRRRDSWRIGSGTVADAENGIKRDKETVARTDSDPDVGTDTDSDVDTDKDDTALQTPATGRTYRRPPRTPKTALQGKAYSYLADQGCALGLSRSAAFAKDVRWYEEPTEEEMMSGKRVEMWDLDLDQGVDVDVDKDTREEISARAAGRGLEWDLGSGYGRDRHSWAALSPRDKHVTVDGTTSCDDRYLPAGRFDNPPAEGARSLSRYAQTSTHTQTPTRRARLTRSTSLHAGQSSVDGGAGESNGPYKHFASAPARLQHRGTERDTPSSSGSKRRRLCSFLSISSVTPGPVTTSSRARFDASQATTESSCSPAENHTTVRSGSTRATSVRRRLWPHVPTYPLALCKDSPDSDTDDELIDGWNRPISPPLRFSPASAGRGGRKHAWDSDTVDDSDPDFTPSFPGTRAAVAAADNLELNTRSEAHGAICQTIDQVRHVGTHLSAKYGLDEMFAHARSLLAGSDDTCKTAEPSTRRAAYGGRVHLGDKDSRDEGKDGSEDEHERDERHVPLGGLSFFLGCPKRHPKLPTIITALEAPHASTTRRTTPAAHFDCPDKSMEYDADPAWNAKVEQLKRGIRELERHSPGFSHKIFIHSHETGNLALSPPSPRALPDDRHRQTAGSAVKQDYADHEVMLGGYRAQMAMMSAAGLRNLVVHPGAANHLDEQTACRNIAANLDQLLDEYPSITVVLESMTCTPRGSLLGTSPSSLSCIRAASRHPDRLKFCIDLCHVHSASHDLSTAAGRAAFDADVARYLGRENVVLVHVSECGAVSGSGADVHRPFGQGYIGSHAIRQILRSELFNPPSASSAHDTTTSSYSSPHADVSIHHGHPPPSGPVIIIETPRYLPHTTSSPRAQSLETRRCALDIAYLHRLSAWDDEAYNKLWAQWEEKVYRPRLAALRVEMRRCITPGSAGETGMEDRVRKGRKGRARLERWRRTLRQGDGCRASQRIKRET